jgi:MFS family permease
MATQPASAGTTESPETPYPSPRYAWYVVGVLTLMYVFSFIDRQIFALIVGPLRRDLQITDTQVSVLQGFIFAVFYTFCGIPLGRMADKYSRRGIIACGLVAWSGFTTMCGLAKNFVQMLAWRMGVGVEKQRCLHRPTPSSPTISPKKSWPLQSAFTPWAFTSARACPIYWVEWWSGSRPPRNCGPFRWSARFGRGS